MDFFKGDLLQLLPNCRKDFWILFASIAVFELVFQEIRESYRIAKAHRSVVNEIKFVKNTNKLCKVHIYNNIVCTEHKKADQMFECSTAVLKWIIAFFDSSNKSLDITIYLVTCVEFREAILRAKNRGVVVRLLTDYTMAKGSGSAIPIFIQEGIPVRMHDCKHMMHCKSAVADNKMVLMGSGNWTMQALAGNWDGWMKTSDPTIVRDYVRWFKRQWSDPVLLQPTLKEFQAFRLDH